MLKGNWKLKRSKSMNDLVIEGIRKVTSSDPVTFIFHIFDSSGDDLRGSDEISDKYGSLKNLKVVDKLVKEKIGEHLTKKALSREEVEKIRISKAAGYDEFNPSSKAILLSERKSLIFGNLIWEFFGGKYIPGCAYNFIACLPVKKEELSV